LKLLCFCALSSSSSSLERETSSLLSFLACI
jgi:hypothetical protein